MGAECGPVLARCGRARFQPIQRSVRAHAGSVDQLPRSSGAQLSSPLVVGVVALVIGVALGFLVATLRASGEKQTLKIALESERVRREAEARSESERIASLEQAE